MYKIRAYPLSDTETIRVLSRLVKVKKILLKDVTDDMWLFTQLGNRQYKWYRLKDTTE